MKISVPLLGAVESRKTKISEVQPPPGGWPGEIITFYSYKGGTGRSMALANVGCLIAQNLPKSEKVLMVDWDLEAPGLDAYFPDRRRLSIAKTSQEPRDGGGEGVIDMFIQIEQELTKIEESHAADTVPVSSQAPEEGGADSRKSAISRAQLNELLEKVKPEEFAVDTRVPNLKLLRAGRFDPDYSKRVNTFDWEALYDRAPLLFRVLSERLGSHYRYVLLDSRTGLTDISGICTMLMPQKLVVVFTPNRQSLTGIRDLVRRASDYRRESFDERALTVFPLPSRIETNQPRLMHRWRLGDPELDIEGYQPIFEGLFRTVYDLERCDLEEYFNEVKIQQIEDYAYGEQIAVLEERRSSMDRFSLARSYQTFTERLVNLSGPWMKMDDQEGQVLALAQVSEPYAMRVFSFFKRNRLRIALWALVNVTLVALFLAFFSFQATQRSEAASLRLTQVFREQVLKAQSEAVSAFQQVDKLRTDKDALEKEVIDANSVRKGLSDQLKLLQETNQNLAQQAVIETETVERIQPDTKRPVGSGYIWLGTWDGDQWTSVNLADPETNRAITIRPEEIKAGSIYRLRTNMIMRDGLPEDGHGSSRGKRRYLGILPEEMSVKVDEIPQLLPRFGCPQYWILVQLQGVMP